ncbi:MAG: NAD(P)H-hydrate dehydratase, partial [Candidatus Baltobacteraceae bacterium]
MMYVLTPAEMRAAEAEASGQSSTTELMRDAGSRIAKFICAHHSPGRVVAFAGPGNNGGDAFAALAELDSRYERIVYAAEAPAQSEARRDARERARSAGVATYPLPERDDTARAALRGADLAVDGLFGTRARLPLGETFRAAARALDARRLPVLAIDIPSGVDALTGDACDDAVRANATVALAALKPGLLLDPARERCGDIWLADIGISSEILRRHATAYCALDDAAFVELLPVRSRDGDKRSAGAPLIVAGSEQFPGAAVLCARAAARAGAGYVTVATPAAAAPAVRAHLIEQVVVTFRSGSPEEAAQDLLDTAKRNSSVAIGPGLNLDDWTGSMLRHFLQRLDLPVVVDASAFFHLAKRLDILRGKRCVLTPHEGEFARLSGKGTIADGDRVGRLREFVDRTGIVTLLKGRSTLVYDGLAVEINTTGTQALATAGTGDVLTGI